MKNFLLLSQRLYFVCPTEIVEFAKLAKHFEERDAVLLGGSTDNEFSKLAWRREHIERSVTFFHPVQG